MAGDQEVTTLRAIAIGDLHLCRGPKNADRVAALDYVLANAPRPIDIWLWPGDLTDAGMTIEIRNYLAAVTQRMADEAPVVIVPGNHDPDGDLDFLARLKAAHPILVVTRPEVVEVALDRMKQVAAIACIPYPSKGVLVSQGVPHDQLHTFAEQAFDTLFMGLGATLQKHRSAGQPVIAIGHATIGGAVASTGQPQIGTELEITEAHLARLGECPKIFNHIHKEQLVGDEARYVGSLCRMDWGEIELKGFVELQFGAKGWGGFGGDGPWASAGPAWDYDWRLISVPVPAMYHVEGTLTRDTFDWRVTKGPGGPNDDPPASWEGVDVRVRASYAQQEKQVLAGAFERVKATFAGARRFEFEPIAVPDRAIRAPEVIQEQTFDGKLRAMSKLSGVAWSEKIEACAQELQAVEDGEAVARIVAAKLEPLADLSAEGIGGVGVSRPSDDDAARTPVRGAGPEKASEATGHEPPPVHSMLF